MDQQATFRFHGGPSHLRTPRISKETWKKHETTIRALFPTSTLRELMDVMETQHGFKATEKQYIHQLPKWGLHKRVVKQGTSTGRSPSHVSPERNPPQPTDPGGQEGGGRDSPPSPFTTTPGTQTQYTLSPQDGFFQETPDSRLDLPPDAYTPRDYQPVVGGKRSRSIVSSASQVSGRSARDWNKRYKVWTESPVTSPKAPVSTDFATSPWALPRTQYEHELQSPDTYGGGALGIDSPWSPGTTVLTSTGVSQDQPETPATAVSDPPDDAAVLPHGLPLEAGFHDWTTAELHEALEAAAQQVFQRTLSDDPRVRVAKRHKLALRLSRLAETLLRRHAAAWPGGPATTRTLRGVAEYLQAVGRWSDAFYLYAFLLGAAEEAKQQQQPAGRGEGGSPSWSLGALRLACAGAANTPAQCAMVRTWPAASAPAAFYGYQRFLQHGVGADMYGRAELPAEAALEAAEARRLLATAGGFGTACVAGVRFGRNADLVAYSYLVRFGGGGGAPETPSFAGYDRFVHRVWEAPVHGTGAGGGGAAERNDDDGRDPLADLRSVLRWCFRAVDPTAATDGDAVFSTFSEIDEANSAVVAAPDELGPAALDPRALGLFHCLFDRWIQLRDPTPPSPSGRGGDEETWLWTQTQERMGLAPTEFLAVLCEMITEAGSGSGGGSGIAPERSPVSYTAFIEQLDALDALPDAALADRFLAHFCAREAMSHRTGLPEASPPSPPPSIRLHDDEDGPASSTPTPTGAAAAGTRPGTGAGEPDDDVRSRSAPSAVAPSYASSDMSSLRRMARRARRLVGSPGDGGGGFGGGAAPHHDEPPSRLLRRPSLTVSELSERFSESMSIGSSSRPSLWAPRSRQRNSGGAWDEWKPRGG